MATNIAEQVALLADNGHTFDNVRKTMEVRNLVAVIPMRKNARCHATRYDKTAEGSLGFIGITSSRFCRKLLDVDGCSFGN